MTAPLSDASLDQLFRGARTRNAWQAKDVPETLVMAAYELAKMGSTAANSCPARFFFIRSDEAKQRLKPHLSPANVEKTMSAPWVVVFAIDTHFYEKMPVLFPHVPDASTWFTSVPDTLPETSMRNASLQCAYFMLAARSLGLDCGPMSGFNQAGLDQEFFVNDPTMAHWKSNFLCNIGYGSDENLFPRLPRLSFQDACRIA